jgi:hypothetical protein
MIEVVLQWGFMALVLGFAAGIGFWGAWLGLAWLVARAGGVPA